MAITAAESKLISIFIQTLLYGAYSVVFIITCWVLLAKRPKGQSINKTMLTVSIVMFVLATMHIGVNYTRIIKAFVIFPNSPGGPGAFFNQLSEFTQIFGSTIYVTQTLVGDSVVLLRAYMVWGKRFSVVALPCLLLFGSSVTGGGILYSFAKVEPEAEIFVVELSHWVLSFFSMTLATNIFCTGLVAVRIWDINRRSISFSHRTMRPIMLLVIESGAIYSYVLLDAISPIVGLVFSMIIVRIGLGLTSVNGPSQDFGKVSTFHTSTPPNSNRGQGMGGLDNLSREKTLGEFTNTVYDERSESHITGAASFIHSATASSVKLDV